MESAPRASQLTRGGRDVPDLSLDPAEGGSASDGAALAADVLVGTLLGSAFGLSSGDPIAAIVVVIGAGGLSLFFGWGPNKLEPGMPSAGWSTRSDSPARVTDRGLAGRSATPGSGPTIELPGPTMPYPILRPR